MLSIRFGQCATCQVACAYRPTPSSESINIPICHWLPRLPPRLNLIGALFLIILLPVGALLGLAAWIISFAWMGVSRVYVLTSGYRCIGYRGKEAAATWRAINDPTPGWTAWQFIVTLVASTSGIKNSLIGELLPLVPFPRLERQLTTYQKFVPVLLIFFRSTPRTENLSR